MAELVQDDGFDVVGLEHNQVGLKADLVASAIVTAFCSGALHIYPAMRQLVTLGICAQENFDSPFEQEIQVPGFLEAYTGLLDNLLIHFAYEVKSILLTFKALRPIFIRPAQHGRTFLDEVRGIRSIGLEIVQVGILSKAGVFTGE